MASMAVETKMKKAEGSFTSTFVGLSGFPDSVGQYTCSPAVELEDRIWSLRIYPGGYDQESEGFLSCFVACESLEPIRASFRISVLNQKGWKNHHYVSDSVKQFQISNSSRNYWGDSKFIARANLRNPANGICVDDTIIIRVELTIYGNVEQFTKTPQLHVIGSPYQRRRSMMDDLSGLLHDTVLSDVTIICPSSDEVVAGSEQAMVVEDHVNAKLSFDDEKHKVENSSSSSSSLVPSMLIPMERISAHKFILSLRSPVFKAMFSSQMWESKTNEVYVEDIVAPVMREFLGFLYTDQCESRVLEKYAEPLLAAACKYQIAGLESLCENHLCAALSVTNAVHVLHLADMYNAHQLKARALHYIAHNAKAVVQTEGFFQSLSFALCQEVIRALAGVDPNGIGAAGSGSAGGSSSAGAGDSGILLNTSHAPSNIYGNSNNSHHPHPTHHSPSTESSPGKPSFMFT